ncbi:DNA binding protein [Mycobacterium phage Moonbeam]|uniref:Helix-turn-helix DNA binding domain protein n=1 Tax=Mycobacterium phage Moonbeam TaxID=2767561 RepID=A0A7G9UX96_9CAUD|nr:DNA binding protein [Mycobacterium phage Moonbeam]QNN98651.1 helix-turn-helix DNA binding domain protein [Mycobacterium phage Moonbeam]
MSNGNRLTNEQVKRILSMTRDGFSARHIAEVVGCSPRTVTRVRAAADARVMNPDRFTPLTADQLEFAEYLLEDGAPYQEVASTLGASRTTIEKHFPGRAWKPKQIAEYQSLMVRFRRLEAS